MAINYTLNIGSVKKRLTEGEFSNIIVEASFGVSASSTPVTSPDPDGNEIVTVPSFSYSCGGIKSFSVEDLDSENFIDFENVTKDTVVQWLLDSEGAASVEDFSYVKSSIQNIAQRIYEHGLEVPASVPGEDPSGASAAEYVPHAPAPQPPASEEVVDAPDAPTEPIA